jgi:hypothetical protein
VKVINVQEQKLNKNSNSNNKPVKCRIVKIENRRGYPNFHFEIDGKMYIYGIEGIRTDYKIVLRCTKPFSGKA